MMLTTSVGFSIDMHYCQGQFKNLSFIGEAQTCHDMAEKMESNHCAKKQKPCHQKESPSCSEKEEHDGCCDSNTILVQLDEDYVQSNVLVLEQDQYHFLVAFCSTYLVLEDISSILIHYQNYKPPLLDKDIHVLTQTFLC